MLNTTADKNTIGLTPEGRVIMLTIMEMNLFKEQIDVAKFAISLAINSGIQPSQVERAETVWNVGSFDSDNHLRQLIPILFLTCEAPYRAVEHLIDAGLKQIKLLLDSGTFDLVRILEEQEVTQNLGL